MNVQIENCVHAFHPKTNVLILKEFYADDIDIHVYIRMDEKSPFSTKDFKRSVSRKSFPKQKLLTL